MRGGHQTLRQGSIAEAVTLLALETAPKKTLAYLSLQATREGQASHAHVHEIIHGLRQRNWQVRLFDPLYGLADLPVCALKRAIEFLRVQFALLPSMFSVQAIYIRSHAAAFPTALWARLFRIPVAQEINGTVEDLFIAWPWTRRFARLLRWLMRMQLKWADAVVVVTPQLKEWVISEVGQLPVYVITNGANTVLFSPEAVSSRALPERYLVFFGALALWQGIDTLLGSVERPEWPQDVHLVIAGDGVKLSLVRQVADRNSRVVYLGLIPYKEMPGIVARSIAGLSPQNNISNRSDKGLSPLKVFETLACGVPVIVTDFPGQADLVRSGHCGLIVPPEDVAALAQAVCYLYERPQEAREMGARGHDLVVHEHSWDHRAEATAAVLDRVIKIKR